MEDNLKIKKILKKSVYFFIVILIIAVIGLMILRYHVEGEQNMPFNLSEILVVSTAEGYEEEVKEENNWNFEIYQTNDVYLTIKKNKNYKETQAIKSIEIKNINIDNPPKIGNIEIYVPNNENKTFKYTEENKITNQIKYEGDMKSDINNFKISNQGGTIIFRILNKTGKKYVSNDEEIKHDGTLLNKVNANNEDIKLKISFDLIINLESEVAFSGKIELELPTEDITTQGITNLDIQDTKNIIFKRN